MAVMTSSILLPVIIISIDIVLESLGRRMIGPNIEGTMGTMVTAEHYRLLSLLDRLFGFQRYLRHER